MRKAAKQTIGMIGLGLMGTAFSRNLIADGYPMVGVDPDAEAQRRFQRLGGKVLRHPREAAEEADLLFLSLPNSKVSLRAARGRTGFLAFAAGDPPEAVIDTTTADPEDTRTLAAMCREKGIPFLDGCVSGNSKMVAERKGLFLVGGEGKIYRKMEPILARLLSDRVHCGPAGSGATLKVLTNYLTAMERCAVAETLRMGLQSGIKGDRLLDVLQRSAADGEQLRRRGPVMLSGRFDRPVSTLDVIDKDLRLGLKLAKGTGVPTPMGGACLPLFTQGKKAGYGPLDSAVVIRVYADRQKKET